MIKIPVTFETTDAVVEFVRITNQFPFHMDLVSGKRIVDAKSLLGTMAIGQASNLFLIIHATPSLPTKTLLTKLSGFLPDDYDSSPLHIA